MRIFEAGDTGPSGHGQVFRGHVKHMLDREVELTVRTHQWGWNPQGFIIDRPFTDSRFKNAVITSDRFNEDYYVADVEEARKRPDDLTRNLGTNTTVRSKDCPIRDFTGREDVWHAIGGMEWVPMAPDRKDVFTVMETDYNLNHVPQQWVRWAKNVDEVWVPNQWVYDAFKSAGYTDNIEIVPYGVDFSYRPTDYDCGSCPANKHTQPPGGGNCLRDDKFTFFSVARWYHIKGVDVLLEAFLREFSGDENVRLFLKTTSNNQFQLDGGGVGQAVKKLTNQLDIDNPPEIGLRTEMMDDQHLMDLYGLADCFAFPSRAECVGISWIQAMHAGTPVVTTNWSAMEEYIDSDEAVLVDEGEAKHPESRVEWLPRKGGEWYPEEAEWFEPDIEAVQRALRKVYEMDGDERAKIAERGQKMVHETFDWKEHIETRTERFREGME
ncbi:MAG: glycosyltransferase family 4 protein [Candidatus Nanohaloarchaea archaeon]